MSESDNPDVELPLVPTAEEQDDLTWRDDIHFRAAEHAAREWIEMKDRPVPSVAIYAAAEAAVEARDRELARRIEDEFENFIWMASCSPNGEVTENTLKTLKPRVLALLGKVGSS